MTVPNARHKAKRASGASWDLLANSTTMQLIIALNSSWATAGDEQSAIDSLTKLRCCALYLKYHFWVYFTIQYFP